MKKVLAIVACVLFSLPMFSQEADIAARANTNKLIIALVPQSTAEHCLRFDMERRLSNGSSVIIAPRFYAEKPDNADGTNDGKMVGLGGEVFHKIRINELTNPVRPYIMYGFLYTYYDVVDATTTQTATTESHVGINKLGPDLAIGLEMEPIKRFIIDLYAGMGARYSFVTKGSSSYINDQNSILDKGYTGILPLCVVKIGVVF